MALKWSQEDWGEGSPMTQLRGQPGVMSAQWEGAREWDRLRVCIQYRDTGAHWIGFLLPFIPVFNSIEDPEEYPIVVQLQLWGEGWKIDEEQLRLYLDENGEGLRPKAMPWEEHGESLFLSEYLFDATYADAETLRVEFPLIDPDGNSHSTSVAFSKGEGRLNDHRSIMSAFPHRLSTGTYMTIHETVTYLSNQGDACLCKDGAPD